MNHGSLSGSVTGRWTLRDEGPPPRMRRDMWRRGSGRNTYWANIGGGDYLPDFLGMGESLEIVVPAVTNHLDGDPHADGYLLQLSVIGNDNNL